MRSALFLKRPKLSKRCEFGATAKLATQLSRGKRGATQDFARLLCAGLGWVKRSNRNKRPKCTPSSRARFGANTGSHRSPLRADAAAPAGRAAPAGTQSPRPTTHGRSAHTPRTETPQRPRRQGDAPTCKDGDERPKRHDGPISAACAARTCRAALSRRRTPEFPDSPASALLGDHAHGAATRAAPVSGARSIVGLTGLGAACVCQACGRPPTLFRLRREASVARNCCHDDPESIQGWA